MLTNNLHAIITVIMPNYNNEKFISQAIDSVLQQDYPNIELIVIDDGSTDNSLEILKSYGSRIVLLSQQNKGAAAARNLGIKFAHGSYISFLDSDDIWLQGKLSTQIDFLNKNSAYVACFCGWQAWDGLDIPQHQHSLNYQLQQDHTGWLYLKLLHSSIISTITIIIRKEIVDQVGYFDEQLTSGEDHDYWIRLSRIGMIAKINQLFALYRRNPKSITNSVQPKNFSLVVLKNNVEKYGLCNPDGKRLELSEYNNFIADRNFVYGYQCFWNGHRDKAKLSFMESVKSSKYFFKSSIYLLICQFDFIYMKIVNSGSR